MHYSSSSFSTKINVLNLSTTSIKKSLKHWLAILDESVWEDGGNVDPCGEDGFTKGIHGVEIMSLNSLAIIPKLSVGFNEVEDTGYVQKI